ncbi:MAG: hypothetical protein NC132_00890 [Corallococcus sp.]|nr:hypothetical protein [Corallococcus sp.]MCM1394664.1 hypothetical protein [Corallococcus sp.]
MKKCSGRQFVNQEDYLKTVCQNKCSHKIPQKKPHECREYISYTCQMRCGKICVTCDAFKTDIGVEIIHRPNK